VSERKSSFERLESESRACYAEAKAAGDIENTTDAMFHLGGVAATTWWHRTRTGTGETLLDPDEKSRKQVGSITLTQGNELKVDRVADRSVVAKKQGNACGAKGPY
jgi:hypothetical protein